MSKSFPVRPSLEQLKKQAKELLKSHKSGDPDGLRRIQENHPDWGNRSAKELRAARFSLGDAQLVIAREYGCASWPKLKAQVESIMAAIGNPVVEKAKGITWKSTVYEYRTSKNGKRTWMRVAANHQHAYKPPGLYRTTDIDGQGQIRRVQISDVVNRRKLEWWPNQKKARLSESEQLPPEQLPQDPRGPFVWIAEAMKKESLQWVESRQTVTGEVNVFRHFIKDEFHFGVDAVDIKGENTSWDVWIDEKTKQLVEFHNPGSDVFDPETDPAHHNPPEKEWAIGKIAGGIDYDIVFDAELDDSLFRLEAPEGYVVENWVQPPLPQITEQEIIDYFGIMSDFNNQTFPDQINLFPFSFDRFAKLLTTPKGERTAAEQKFTEAQHRYDMAGLGLPVDHFIENSTEKNSFRYLGKGIKLGDKDRIVCWYKLKGAKSYRALYGDLSVKDLPPEALPLPVEP
jgi:hypothetical protein